MVKTKAALTKLASWADGYAKKAVEEMRKERFSLWQAIILVLVAVCAVIYGLMYAPIAVYAAVAVLLILFVIPALCGVARGY